ncbi:MAG: GNAT family N-acetyltransferase [Ignavibacteria bacterium]|nr:GNAT family N-acetyltransferase [Ignavibacteria bacterium]
MKTTIKNISVEKSLTVKEVNASTDDKWIEYISNNTQATIYHHPLWLKIIEKETGQRVLKLICTDNNDNIQGLFPLQYTKGFPFGLGGIPGTRRLASLPRTPVCGPLTSNSKVTNLLIQKATDIVSNESDCLLQIKFFDPEINDDLGILYKYFWREIYIKEIPDFPYEIRYGKSKNHAKIKWAVNKAEQNNVIQRTGKTEDDLKKWYSLYLDTMRIHTTPARSYSFFKNLWEILRPKGLMQLQLAEIEENGEKTIIAGSILFFYNKTVTHAFSGSSRRRIHIELRPNDLLHWYAMLDAQKNGFKSYDFGEVSKGNLGLATYKKKWDTVKINLFHYYYPKPAQLEEEDLDSGTRSWLKEIIWQKLPLNLTAKLGEIVYKRL